MWRTVFLDFGGTLARERQSRASIYAEVGRAAGLAVDEQRMRALMAEAHAATPLRVGSAWHYDDAWFRIYMERIFCSELGLPRAELEGVARELFRRFGDPRSFRLLPGAGELVQELRARGLVVAILSNWSSALSRLVAGLALPVEAEHVHSSALVGCEKPDPAFFRLALERCRADPRTTLHAGDNYSLDVLGARAAGITPVWVAGGGEAPPSAETELLCVASLFELRSLILDARP